MHVSLFTVSTIHAVLAGCGPKRFVVAGLGLNVDMFIFANAAKHGCCSYVYRIIYYHVASTVVGRLIAASGFLLRVLFPSCW